MAESGKVRLTMGAACTWVARKPSEKPLTCPISSQVVVPSRIIAAFLEEGCRIPLCPESNARHCFPLSVWLLAPGSHVRDRGRLTALRLSVLRSCPHSLEGCSSFGWISAGNNNIWFLGPLLLVWNHCDRICCFEPIHNTVFLFCVTGQVMCLLGVNE